MQGQRSQPKPSVPKKITKIVIPTKRQRQNTKTVKVKRVKPIKKIIAFHAVPVEKGSLTEIRSGEKDGASN